MADRPQAREEARDFAGMISNVDPLDLPPGAATEQVNLQCVKLGQMETRAGYLVVRFDE